MAFAEPTLASAGADPLSAQIDQQAAAGGPRRYRLGDYYNGVATGNVDRSDWYIALEQGRCYWFSGAGGPEVRELFLYLWDSDDHRVADNRAKSPTVTLGYCAKQGGMHHLQAKVARGSGPYRVGVYSDTPSGRGARPVLPVSQQALAPHATTKPAFAPPAGPSKPSLLERARGLFGSLPNISATSHSSHSTSTTTHADGQAHEERSHRETGIGVATGAASAAGSPSLSVSHSQQTTRSSSSTSDGSAAANGSARCAGDFTLGSSAMINSQTTMGTECNNYYSPTNCPTGLYIQFPKRGKCYCIVRCTELAPAPAPSQSCTSDGSWICQDYRSTIAKNHATFCAPTEWNLCH